MRAVKSVLVMAGSLKRANPDLPEEVVLIRAMRDSNLPKFLTHDVELFVNIIGDLFPGVHVPSQVPYLGSLSIFICFHHQLQHHTVQTQGRRSLPAHFLAV
jgi:hypothetical protein